MTENKDAAEVKPVDAGTPAPAQATKPESTEAVKPAAPAVVKDDKTTQAFINMRLEKKADKQRIKELEAKLAAAPATETQPEEAKPAVAAPAVPAVSKAAPAQTKAETGIDQEEAIALRAMAADPDVAAVSGGIMAIMDIVETDPKIAKLYEVDRTIGLQQAKAAWATKYGIAPAPVTPVPTTTSTGMGSEKTDLPSLFKTLEGQKPGTKAYRTTLAKINTAMSQHG